MVFQTGSDNEKIDELQRQVDDIIDSQISSLSGNANISIDASLGGRNSASGDEGGVRSNQPIIHKITDVNESGTSTGVFDKINLISSMIIVDHTSTPMDLKFIQGPAKDGAKIKITVKKDKILVLKTGGDILTSSDITITDTEYYELVKHSEAETGVTGGAYKILKIGSGSGGSGYATIQEEGVSVTQRAIMNFIGANVTAVDNPGDSRTDITIATTTSGLLSALTIDDNKDWNNKKITNINGLDLVGDLNLATHNIINIDQSRYVVDSGVISPITDTVILLNSNSQFQFNTAKTNDFAFSFDGNIGMTLDNNTVNPNSPFRNLIILSDSTDINSTAHLNLTKNFATSMSTQIIGQIGFSAANDAGGGKLEYAAIVGKIEDASAGTIDGSLSFDVTLNNSPTKFMTINDGGSGVIKTLRDLDIGSFNILNIDQSRYVVSSGAVSTSTDTVILLNSNNQFHFNTDQINKFVFSLSNNSAFVINQEVGVNDPRIFTFLSDSSNVNSAVFVRITKTFPIPVDTALIGALEFFAGNSTGVSLAIYASMNAFVVDNTNDTKDGTVIFDVIINNTLTPIMQFNQVSSGEIDLFGDLDMNDHFIRFVEIAKPSDPTTNTGVIYVKDVSGISTPFFLDSAGTETSLIASGSVPNEITAGDSSVSVVDTGTGAIQFTIDGDPVTNISTKWLFGLDLDINNNDILNPTNITLANGFKITNTNSTTTTFAIPNSEILLIKEGSSTRIQVDKNITLNADANKDILLQVGGSTKILLDGSADKLIIQNSLDIQLKSGSFLDFVSSGSPTVGSELGRIQIKVGGVTRSIPFFGA